MCSAVGNGRVDIASAYLDRGFWYSHLNLGTHTHAHKHMHNSLDPSDSRSELIAHVPISFFCNTEAFRLSSDDLSELLNASATEKVLCASKAGRMVLKLCLCCTLFGGLVSSSLVF